MTPYRPTEEMSQLIDEIAATDDLALRFWAAKNLHLETFADGGGAFAIEDAVAEIASCVSAGEPNDADHQLVLGPCGELTGVRLNDEDPEDADDVDRLIYEIVRQSEAEVRRGGLLELVVLSLDMTEAEPFGGPLTQSRFWARANIHITETET